MFKQIIISEESTIDFWKSQCLIGSSINLANHHFQFEKKNAETLITIKNRSVFLNPEIDFLQAKMVKSLDGKESILIGAKKFIQLLYGALVIMAPLFLILIMRTNFVGLIIGFILFGLIFRYNYVKINQAIEAFSKTITDHSL